MATRHRLQDAMAMLACKKQREHEKHLEWKNTTKYFDDWERHNNKFGEWTSDEYYRNSTTEYVKNERKKEKEKRLNERREKLRRLFEEDNAIYGMEITESPRTRQGRRSNECESIPIEILRDVNIGLKIAEDDRRKHEAEMKLYYQWRNDNPIIREHESNQDKAHLKLAWLDQQIEKRMAKEKLEEDTLKMLEDRQRIYKEQEEEERKEMQVQKQREKELNDQIERNLKLYKENQYKYEILSEQEETDRIKQKQIDDLIHKKELEIKKRQQTDLALYNITQSKMKLRQKAIEIEAELKKETELIHHLQQLKLTEAIQNDEQKKKAKASMDAYMKYVHDLQKIEKQRHQYISFIFDSEAKQLWNKQERLWKEERQNRDKLFNNVMTELKQQIEENLIRNEHYKRLIEDEKEQALKSIENNKKILQEERDELERSKLRRKKQLDEQINEKKLLETQRKLVEEKERETELENIRKEEERLKNELLLMQRGRYHPKRYQRRTAFW